MLSPVIASQAPWIVTVALNGTFPSAASSVVKTYVTLLSLVAPEKGKVGKPAVITLGVGNTRYPEAVQIDLYKVTPQGDTWIGTITTDVGVMKLKKARLRRLQPTTRPDSSTSLAWLRHPPSVPRSRILPSCHKKACADPAFVSAQPTTWPRSLMPSALLSPAAERTEVPHLPVLPEERVPMLPCARGTT